MEAKGYMAGKKKLSDLNINGIKYAVLVEGVSLRQVADLYNVSHVQVWRIINGHQRAKPAVIVTNET